MPDQGDHPGGGVLLQLSRQRLRLGAGQQRLTRDGPQTPIGPAQ